MNGTNKNKKNKNTKNFNLNEKKYEKKNEKQSDDELYIATVHDEGSDNNDDDDDRMSNQLSPSVAPTKPVASPNRHHPILNKTLNNFKKSYYQTIIEWVEIDQQQIYPTLHSIYNLRQRLYHTYQYATLLPPSIDDDDDDDDDDDVHGASKSISASSSLVEWSNNGYRHRTKDNVKKSIVGGTLNYDDMQLTIQNNLQHHERMTVQLRHLMSELSDMTNRMSRRYDDLYHASASMACASMDVVDPTTLDVWSAMDECQILYVIFAKELYRKQTLITQMIDTPASSPHGSNDVFGATNDESNDHLNQDEEAVAQESNTERHQRPIRIAKQCTQEWSYSSKCSYIYPFREFVQGCIERYQPTSK